MNRRGLGIVVAALCLLLAAPLPAEAQQAAKVARIGYLGGVSAVPQIYEAFLQGLSTSGTSRVAMSSLNTEIPRGSTSSSPPSPQNWLRSRLMSS
jgi:hypothetical protein